ncbi:MULTISPECIES: hypothetical protein [Xanthobacter]|uniref:Uncharacterized protein n=2 Tax=Xanthobacter TaxID=279 RepID=A0A974SL64_9HYPH|nr:MULTISPECIES: hypothetical protein [Xanthobacter]QRG10196.1 hypothetical protein EZH22_30425 [Xanthobacter dioxanivorans]UDQ88569.1 hypothetical protein LJE71_20375 [Xanthobacter autotrophicus]
MGTSATLPSILQGLIDDMPNLLTMLVVMLAAVGLAMAAFALFKIYQAIQNGDGAPGGWLVAFACGAGLTIVAVIAGQASLLIVGAGS